MCRNLFHFEGWIILRLYARPPSWALGFVFTSGHVNNDAQNISIQMYAWVPIFSAFERAGRDGMWL